MSGDVHVRICESPGVRFPWATRRVVLCDGNKGQGGCSVNLTEYSGIKKMGAGRAGFCGFLSPEPHEGYIEATLQRLLSDFKMLLCYFIASFKAHFSLLALLRGESE